MVELSPPETRAKYMAMTEAQLQQELGKNAWLSTPPPGSKDEMVARLVDNEKPRGGWGMPVPVLSPEELLRAFKQANPRVWTIKDEQVLSPVPCPAGPVLGHAQALTRLFA